MSFKLLIDGKQVAGANTVPVINPADESIVANSPVADQRQLNEAVAAAKRAQPEWAQTPIDERAACLKRLGEAVQAHEADIALSLIHI